MAAISVVVKILSYQREVLYRIHFLWIGSKKLTSTHDNETPHQKRTAADSLANAAIVAMTHSAVGSVKGYDEIYPEILDVVNEKRKYLVPKFHTGIIPGILLLKKPKVSFIKSTKKWLQKALLKFMYIKRMTIYLFIE
jgi:glycogen debranching enzyme